MLSEKPFPLSARHIRFQTAKELNSTYLANRVFWVLVKLKLILSESSFINVPEQTNLRRVYLQAFDTFLQDVGLGVADFCHLCLLLELLFLQFLFFSNLIGRIQVMRIHFCKYQQDTVALHNVRNLV